MHLQFNSQFSELFTAEDIHVNDDAWIQMRIVVKKRGCISQLIGLAD